MLTTLKRRTWGTAVLAVALAGLAPHGLAAQLDAGAPDPSAPASDDLEAHPLANDEIRLDGLLDEDAWARAVPIVDFRQQEPVEGGEPSERTEIRVLYDANDLYIGALLYDSEPSGVLAYQKRRDQSLRTDDRFMFILDTFLDGRTGYFFETNPAGLLGDGLITAGSGRGINKSWDGIWDVRTRVHEQGWSVEVRIPFRTLNFDPALDTWGINFQRTVRRKQEEILWRGHRRNQGLFRPVHAGRLSGLSGLSQGLGLEVKPYATAGVRTLPAESEPTSWPTDIGFDVSYNITPSLRSAVTVNTDFAEVESDDRRVNLTRFPLRFPERRDFFLEGSGVFAFAERNGVSPFFSRRIGLAGGQPVPIRYGARLGGQAGAFELGFIQIATDRNSTVAAEQFTVARVRRAMFEQSSVGAIYTRRATGTDSLGVHPDDRHTIGVDLDLFTSRLFGDKNFQFESFLVYNTNPDPGVDRDTGDLLARGFRLNFPNDIWQSHLSYREFGSAYDPAVGFVTRRNFRRVEPRIGWSPRPEAIAWLRQMEFGIQFRYLADLDTGAPEERLWQFEVLGLEFESGDEVGIEASRQFERLDDAFDVQDGIPILPGDYTNWEWSLDANTAAQRPISGRAEISWGGFWDGDRTTWELSLTGRPDPGINLSAEYQLNQVTLPRGSFDTNLWRLEGGWDISPWASFTGNVQYDDVSELVGLFAKVQWIVQPGNNVFLVYTHNWQRPDLDPLDPRDRPFATISRGATIKVNYTYRF